MPCISNRQYPSIEKMNNKTTNLSTKFAKTLKLTSISEVSIASTSATSCTSTISGQKSLSPNISLESLERFEDESICNMPYWQSPSNDGWGNLKSSRACSCLSALTTPSSETLNNPLNTLTENLDMDYEQTPEICIYSSNCKDTDVSMDRIMDDWGFFVDSIEECQI